MMKFIDKANLPEGKVTAVICGTDDESILSYFNRKGISVIKNAPNRSIDSAVSSHADMAAIHLGGKNIIIDKNRAELELELTSIGMKVIKSEADVSGEYPCDIGLNFAVSSERIIGKFSCADKALLSETVCLERLDVRQGYCKCSTLVISENAIVTDDEGIYRVACEKGVESLLVSKGDITLEGHSYGFIGGASGKMSKNTVVFFGNIEKHRDSEKIKAFLSEHGCGYECTDAGELRDIGGIVPLTEEI